MKTLQDFQKAIQPGAKIVRRFPNSPSIQPQTSIVASVFRDFIVFASYSLEMVELHKINLESHLEFIRQEPHRRGLHFDWPEPGTYRIEDSELIIHDKEGRDYVALRVVEWFMKPRLTPSANPADFLRQVLQDAGLEISDEEENRLAFWSRYCAELVDVKGEDAPESDKL